MPITPNASTFAPGDPVGPANRQTFISFAMRFRAAGGDTRPDRFDGARCDFLDDAGTPPGRAIRAVRRDRRHRHLAAPHRAQADTVRVGMSPVWPSCIVPGCRYGGPQIDAEGGAICGLTPQPPALYRPAFQQYRLSTISRQLTPKLAKSILDK